ncbi:hypothetical protein FRX31_002530 [Thalictrum thalictroides]|uniref:Uncharacterized protein n=1 Tax=Thalictrum thalictroides TaxID=46969 RepID=A0A7J6XDQ7_THATH|nr:hypothetical protein FRX31_002530 [Thalictrum thalictroides]
MAPLQVIGILCGSLSASIKSAALNSCRPPLEPLAYVVYKSLQSLVHVVTHLFAFSVFLFLCALQQLVV